MTVVMAALAGLGGVLFGLAYGLLFAAALGTLAGVLPAALGFGLAGVAAGALTGAFGTLIGGDPIEERGAELAPGPADVGPRKGTVRVWTEETDEAEVFEARRPEQSPPPRGPEDLVTDRKERPWT
jgi:hypothetical protein